MRYLEMNRRPRAAAVIAIAINLLLSMLAGGSPALCETSKRDIEALAKAQLIYVATVRKDGNQSTAAPVWFTVTPEHLILINTGPNTWKSKRIRRGSPVIVWIDDEQGPAFIGKAEITNEPALLKQIIEDYPKKYLQARVGLHKPSQESFDKGDRVAMKITPVRDLPEGFTSKPGTPPPTLDSAR